MSTPPNSKRVSITFKVAPRYVFFFAILFFFFTLFYNLTDSFFFRTMCVDTILLFFFPSPSFFVVSSWKGKKSRDVPGRVFSLENSDILQEWALQFRSGDTLSDGENDTRIVSALTINPTKPRVRKPYSGNNQGMNRFRAFRT